MSYKLKYPASLFPAFSGMTFLLVMHSVSVNQQRHSVVGTRLHAGSNLGESTPLHCTAKHEEYNAVRKSI